MKTRLLTALLSTLLLGAIPSHADGKTPVQAETTSSGSFTAGKSTFLLNGEPFVVKAAELHYPRIPREYWGHRIDMCKALGMNTVCLYVFWNAHEPRRGQFDFTGQNDLRAFVELCKEKDMKVILRPGPYVCAEWEMGGLPWWLLKNKEIRLREDDPYFLECVDSFQKAVAAQVGDLTIDNGGPIVMVQVENEYGSYGKNKPYVAAIRDMLRRNFGDNVTLFQCDWSSNYLDNGLDDLIWTMNFGTGADIDQQFASLRKYRPDSPLMCSEFWSGWFDKWGANHETRPADAMVGGIDEMLSKGISFSLYMTHGGTNWGHWAGANSPGYAPDVTSYDYDAPINEQGAPTPKYYKLRETLSKYLSRGEPLPKVPSAIPVVAVEEFRLSEAAPLFASLPEPKTDMEIKTMEEYDQGFGSILYRTTLPQLSAGSVLTVTDPHDYAQVFIDGKYAGTLDRRNGDREITLPECNDGAVIDILVEAMGRINFGRAIKDFKGITEKVEVSEKRGDRTFVCNLDNWQVFNLPDSLDFYRQIGEFFPVDSFSPGADGRLPCGVYTGTFNVRKAGDTFLDMSSWGKGLVYVNGHGLGRFWEIGPQQTLYLPGCWLRKGENEIVVFDILGPREAKAAGLASPELDRLLKSRPDSYTRQGEAPVLDGAVVAVEESFAPGNGWHEVQFPSAVSGRYLVLEALDSHDGSPEAAIAELYLLDEKGERLSREPWSGEYASSEQASGVNRTLDKVYDLQESTYWASSPETSYPHTLIIDLGKSCKVSAIQYLPRMESGAPGAIRHFRISLLPDAPGYR